MATVAKRGKATELLLPLEFEEFRHCESVIESGLQTFVEVGSALLTIRDKRLYRATHETFEAYCQDRWSLNRRHAYRLMDAAAVVENLCPIGHNGDGTLPQLAAPIAGQLPETESQARPLAGLEPDEQRAVWTKAVETAPNGKPTAKHVETTARVFRDERSAEPHVAHVTFCDPDDIPPGKEVLKSILPADEDASGPDSERLRKRFSKCLDDVDDLTRAVAARVKDGGYGGFPTLATAFDTRERRQLKGKIEILMERLKGWTKHL